MKQKIIHEFSVSTAAGCPVALVMLAIPCIHLDEDLPLPTYAHIGDAGLDLYAREDRELLPAGGRALIPTGIALAIPQGYAGFVQPRSGLALKHGVTCLNTPGLIDSGYRGEIRVILVNTDPHISYTIRRGERIAQLVIQEVTAVVLQPCVSFEENDATTRGESGFGSSGK